MLYGHGSQFVSRSQEALAHGRTPRGSRRGRLWPEGCAHARPGDRQVLLIDRETLEAMDLRPGILRENITADGLNVNGLQPGQLLQIGEARIQISGVCTPCDQMEKIRPGLRKELWGRRGMLGRVLEGGIIRPGDPIEKVP